MVRVVCTKCKSKLDANMVCTNCGAQYDIVDGIPIMWDEEKDWAKELTQDYR